MHKNHWVNRKVSTVSQTNYPIITYKPGIGSKIWIPKVKSKTKNTWTTWVVAK